MNRLHLQHLGRFGNQLFGVAFALGYAKRHNLKLTMDPWVGQQIFVDLPGVEYCETPPGAILVDEHNFSTEGLHPVVAYRSYSQCQRCADYYTRKECKEWFKLRPEVEEKLKTTFDPTPRPIRFHVRRGDFAGYGYPLISLDSYDNAASEYNLGDRHICITDERPFTVDGLPDFLPDFYLLMTAKVLLRANSSFSYWAAVLSDALVLSPVIDGLEGGKEHDVQFVPGNWPKLAELGFVTDIHLKEV